MNWDRIEGKWKQVSGSAKEKWGRAINNQWDITEGRRSRRAGEMQEAYGIGKEQAQRQLQEWQRRSNRSASL
jgi:uncharacterized protein YjbJ (UPF0337 family)